MSYTKLIKALKDLISANETVCSRQIESGECEGGFSCLGGCEIYEALKSAKEAIAEAESEVEK